MSTLLNSVQTLFDNLDAWPTAKNNFAALKSLESRSLKIDNLDVTLLFNPARVRSTAANLNADAIKQRPCFLCQQNRPSEQKFIDWRNFQILINPYPIFPHHLTVASKSHTPQLPVALDVMSALARELSGFTIFFNGANSGATAPDHLHFQAADGLFAPSPLEKASPNANFSLISENNNGKIECATIANILIYRLLPKDDCAAQSLFADLLSLRHISSSDLNITARLQSDGRVVLLLIPRRALRPKQFYAQGDEQLLVSPASVEVSGIFVLPRKEDFIKITVADVSDILSQVCYNSDAQLLSL